MSIHQSWNSCAIGELKNKIGKYVSYLEISTLSNMQKKVLDYLYTQRVIYIMYIKDNIVYYRLYNDNENIYDMDSKNLLLCYLLPFSIPYTSFNNLLSAGYKIRGDLSLYKNKGKTILTKFSGGLIWHAKN